jgi:hypothetical protein
LTGRSLSVEDMIPGPPCQQTALAVRRL